MTRRLRILFYTTQLGGGGAEKNLVRVANHLDPERFAVSVAVSRAGGSYEPELADHVALRPLAPDVGSSTGGLLLSSAGLLRELALRPADLLCPVMATPACIALSTLLPMPGRPRIVPSIQNNPAMIAEQGVVGKATDIASRFMFPKADHIIALSKGVAEELLRRHPSLPGTKIDVVHNAALDENTAELLAQPLPPKDGPTVVAMGRLHPQKGYEVLLSAWREVVAKFPNATLWILGRGHLDDELRSMAAGLGIDASVKFLGFRDNPWGYLQAADAFVLSSHYEGFGNVVAEAMVAGTPVVSTDCPYGPGEIISHEENGLLVPVGDATSLATALCRLLDNPELRQRFSAAGVERAQAFRAESIASGYGSVFAKVVS